MFISNKYTRIYYAIVNKALQAGKPSEYCELHHVIPKALGGSNDTGNLVYLTAKQHFICHLLLPKMCNSVAHKEKMVYALWCMINGNGHATSRYIPSARAYEKIKVQLAVTKSYNMLGEKNHFFGKKHSDESKKKMSDNNAAKREDIKEKLRGPRPGYKPNNHYNGWDEATKEKISQSLTGKKHSEKTKQKMSDYKKNTVWVKKDGEKSRMVHLSILENFLSDGWSRGRGKIKSQE